VPTAAARYLDYIRIPAADSLSKSLLFSLRLYQVPITLLESALPWYPHAIARRTLPALRYLRSPDSLKSSLLFILDNSLRQLLRQEGLHGAMRGVAPRLLLNAPTGAAAAAIYELALQNAQQG